MTASRGRYRSARPEFPRLGVRRPRGARSTAPLGKRTELHRGEAIPRPRCYMPRAARVAEERPAGVCAPGTAIRIRAHPIRWPARLPRPRCERRRLVVGTASNPRRAGKPVATAWPSSMCHPRTLRGDSPCVCVCARGGMTWRHVVVLSRPRGHCQASTGQAE